MRRWLRRWLLGDELEELVECVRDLVECVRDLVELEGTNGNGPVRAYYDKRDALRDRLGMEKKR